MNAIIRERTNLLATMPAIDPNKLLDYKHVKQVTVGAYVRWVPKDELTFLSRGGFVVSVQKHRVLCRNVANTYFAFDLRHCHVFQKINSQEYIYLLARDAV